MKNSSRERRRTRKKQRTHRIIFGRMSRAMLLFLVMIGVLLVERRNVVYEKKERQLEILENSSFDEEPFHKEPECVIYWDSGDANSVNAYEEMAAVLSQMRIAFTEWDMQKGFASPFSCPNLILALSDFSLFGEQILDLFDQVRDGRNLLVLCPPYVDVYYNLVKDKMGIRETGYDRSIAEGIAFQTGFMIGGEGRSLEISDPFDSSNQVYLSEDCTVHLTSSDNRKLPLLWEYTYGSGHVVNVNLNLFEKAYRGFYTAAYSLLADACVWPVINGSAFYLDDFPSPVPAGEGKYIERDYNMDIGTFYTNVWWPDMTRLAEKHGIRYTGLVIENYSDEHALPLKGNSDIQRFRYFGNELLDGGGEIGFHGYNHMPLVLENFDYGEEFESYKQWESEADIRGALQELEDFCTLAYPEEEFQVYVPPSNILSEEGREILAEDFLDIQAIASIYFEGEYEYSQDFEVAEDGMIETPRIISGLIIDPYMETAALSELNFHFVNSHFLHPDDVLDEDRGAKQGWEKLCGRLEEYMDWLYTSAPMIRNLTGSEIAGAVQRYYYLDTEMEETEDEIRIRLSNFQDEAWLLARVNGKTVTETENGEAVLVADDLYLVHALGNEVVLNLE